MSFGDVRLTYRDLDHRANRAILKAGAYYVPPDSGGGLIVAFVAPGDDFL